MFCSLQSVGVTMSHCTGRQTADRRQRGTILLHTVYCTSSESKGIDTRSRSNSPGNSSVINLSEIDAVPSL